MRVRVRVAYAEEYMRRRFVEEGAVVEREGIFHLDVTELSAETRKGLLEVARFDPWKRERDPVLEGENLDLDFDLDDPEWSGSRFVSPDLDLEWAGRRGDQEGRFLLEGPPDGPREWDEVLGRYFVMRKEHNRLRREEEDAELRKLAAGLAKEIEEGDDVEGTSTEARGGRRRGRWNPLDHGLRDYGYATPELLREVEGLQEQVAAVREERARRAQEKQEDREDRERKERDEQEAMAKEQQAEEKRAWIERQGSEHLREAIAAGYECRDLYVRERAALEWPGYEPHLYKHAKWRPFSSPSPEALAEAKRVGGRIVWLTSPAIPFAQKGTTKRDEWSPCEAVIVDGFMGRYFLIKEVR